LISEKVCYGLRRPSRSIIPPILIKDNQELWPKYDYLEARRLLKRKIIAMEIFLKYLLLIDPMYQLINL